MTIRRIYRALSVSVTLALALAVAVSVVPASPASADHIMTMQREGLGEAGPYPHTCIDEATAVEVEGRIWPFPISFKVDPDRFETIWIAEDGTVTTTEPAPGDPDPPVRIRVLLPPGYHGGEDRYPVVYFNPGGDGDASDVIFGSPHEFPVHCFSAQWEPVIWVFADGHSLASHPDASRWETFHVRTLVDAVDARYRTLADRAYRAMIGISAGGYSVMKYAARHPEVFVAVASISGALDGYGEGQVLVWGGHQVALCQFGGLAWRLRYPAMGTRGCPDEPVARGPVTDHVLWRNHNPIDLVPNLRGTWVYAGAGNGVPCDEDEVVHNVMYPGAAVLEAGIPRRDTEAFGNAAARAGVDHMLDLLECGGHDLSTYIPQLENFWPTMIAALGSPPPEDFDHRRVDPEFTVWDWTFTVDPNRAPEFLDIREASREGLVLTGSGLTMVTTAPYFEADEEVLVAVAADGTPVDEQVVKAEGGRLTFTVDLGPPHTHQQFTPQQRALETAQGGAYWHTRTVTFHATETGAT